MADEKKTTKKTNADETEAAAPTPSGEAPPAAEEKPKRQRRDCWAMAVLEGSSSTFSPVAANTRQSYVRQVRGRWS